MPVLAKSNVKERENKNCQTCVENNMKGRANFILRDIFFVSDRPEKQFALFVGRCVVELNTPRVVKMIGVEIGDILQFLGIISVFLMIYFEMMLDCGNRVPQSGCFGPQEIIRRKGAESGNDSRKKKRNKEVVEAMQNLARLAACRAIRGTRAACARRARYLLFFVGL